MTFLCLTGGAWGRGKNLPENGAHSGRRILEYSAPFNCFVRSRKPKIGSKVACVHYQKLWQFLFCSQVEIHPIECTSSHQKLPYPQLAKFCKTSQKREISVAKDKFHGSALTSVVCPIFWALLLHSAVIGIDE